jgi:hypothetical protein
MDSDMIRVTVPGEKKPREKSYPEGGLFEGSLLMPFDTIMNLNIGNLPKGVDLLEKKGDTVNPSDTFIAMQNGANVDLFFVSDPVGKVLFPTKVEDGTLQDVTAEVFPKDKNPPFKVEIKSDVETLPEPATLVLLGSGGLCVLAFARRLRRVAGSPAEANPENPAGR